VYLPEILRDSASGGSSSSRREIPDSGVNGIQASVDYGTFIDE
jgi:hypothetical protein